METLDKNLFSFDVLYYNQDHCSSVVFERPDGKRYLKIAFRDSQPYNWEKRYESSKQELIEKIAEYERAIRQAKKAIELLNHEE